MFSQYCVLCVYLNSATWTVLRNPTAEETVQLCLTHGYQIYLMRHSNFFNQPPFNIPCTSSALYSTIWEKLINAMCHKYTAAIYKIKDSPSKNKRWN